MWFDSICIDIREEHWKIKWLECVLPLWTRNFLGIASANAPPMLLRSTKFNKNEVINDLRWYEIVLDYFTWRMSAKGTKIHG